MTEADVGVDNDVNADAYADAEQMSKWTDAYAEQMSWCCEPKEFFYLKDACNWILLFSFGKVSKGLGGWKAVLHYRRP